MELKIKKLIEKFESEVNPEPDQKEIERYELVKAVLDNPGKRPSELIQQLKKNLGSPPLIFVKGEFRDNRLGWKKNRDLWVRDIRQVGTNLSQFSQEEDNDYRVLHENIKQTMETIQINPRRMDPKAILLVFCNTLSNNVSYKDLLNAVIRGATFKQANTLLHELINLIAAERGLDEQISKEERLGSLVADRAIVEKEPDKTYEQKSEDSEVETDRLLSPGPTVEESLKQIREMTVKLEHLEQERVDLHTKSEIAEHRIREMTVKLEHLEQENAALLMRNQVAEHRVELLQEELVQTRDEADRNAVTSFFQEMNSVKHSSLLDQFLKVGKLLERLRQQETEIPQELELIPTLVSMFSRFLEKQGIQPKYKVGSEREITLSESDQYEYFGSQFENSDERKTIEVLSSGWTYKGDLIIKPKVREVG